MLVAVKRVSNKVKTEGTGLVGYVVVSYDQLVEAFGKPTSQRPSGDDKVRICWDIEFYDGTVATIYDWKNYRKTVNWVKQNYLEWHIGGNDKSAEEKVLAVLKDKKLMFTRLTFD